MRAATIALDVRTGDVPGNLRAVCRALERCAEHGVEIAVLPEMWPTSFVQRSTDDDVAASDDAVRAAARAARDLGILVCGSGFGRPVGGAPEAPPTNRAHVLRGGECVAGYDKVHLFSPTAEHLAFSAGDEPPPVVELENGAGLLSPIICYDLRFPGVARAAFRSGAEILAVSAQWPHERAPHWNALIRGRAAELEGFVIACNRTGSDEIGRRRMRLSFSGETSAVIGPSGDELPAVVTEQVVEACREPTLIKVCEIDLGAARDLRRAVPVRKDERWGVMRAWRDGAVEGR